MEARMKPVPAPVLVLIAALAAACSTPSGPDPVALDHPFDLRVGETAVVFTDGLRITFQEVRNDSRCCIDCYCFWEGDAEVVLQVEMSPADREKVSIRLFTSRHADALGHHIEGRDLMPLNRSGVPIDPKTYVVTLLVTRPEG
jgi:hypothetical protein